MTGPVSSTGAAGQAPQAADPKRREQMKSAAQAFEAVFLRQMIGSMRSASLGEDVLGSSASNQFRDMADGRLADQMAKGGEGFGIAKMLLQQFERSAVNKAGGSDK